MNYFIALENIVVLKVFCLRFVLLIMILICKPYNEYSWENFLPIILVVTEHGTLDTYRLVREMHLYFLYVLTPPVRKGTTCILVLKPHSLVWPAYASKVPTVLLRATVKINKISYMCIHVCMLRATL